MPTQQENNCALKVIGPFEIIRDELARVSTIMTGQLASCPYKSGVDGLLRYITGQSGKMLRPGMVLLCGKCCGKTADEHLQVAAIFEIIHNATLVHDDVVDQSQIRRGKESVNHIYGNESAVLLGDFLLSKVFKMCAELHPPVAKEIASAAARTCEGELNQNLQKHNCKMTESDYIEIITEKTAAIFASCCKLGAFLSGANEQIIQRFADFGLNTGVAFQIIDDLLDISGDKNKTGKNSGKDFETAKPTLPLIHLLSYADKKQKTQLIELLESDSPAANTTDKVKQLLQQTKSLEYTQNCAERYISKALSSIESFPPSPAKTSLIDTAKFILHRVN